VWKKHPAEVIPFLGQRSLNLLARFTADPKMGLKLGPLHNLDQIDEEAHRDLEKYGPGVFRQK